MLISIYGLVFDPATVEPQLATLQDLLPPSAFTLISERVHMLVSKPQGTLTTGLLISTGRRAMVLCHRNQVDHLSPQPRI